MQARHRADVAARKEAAADKNKHLGAWRHDRNMEERRFVFFKK